MALCPPRCSSSPPSPAAPAAPSRINLGDLRPATTDLAKLLLIDFALVHDGDWFLFPLPLSTNTSTRIRGLAVTDVFGERTWVDAAGRGLEQYWQRWSMFSLTDPASATADTRFLLLGTAVKVQEGKPLEEVLLTRDEMANMVWGHRDPGQPARRQLGAGAGGGPRPPRIPRGAGGPQPGHPAGVRGGGALSGDVGRRPSSTLLGRGVSCARPLWMVVDL
jgi:hypothetical protein